MDKLPKDLAAAKRGYEAFYDEQPNIWFEDLAYNYQMRWVRAARAIMDEHKNYKGPGRPNGLDQATNHKVSKKIPTEAKRFWEDIKIMEPKEFLEKHVPKVKSGSGRYSFRTMPAAMAKAARRVHRALINKAWADKRKS
jgi:hypothetical protein